MAPRRYALILSLVALLPAVAWSQTLLTPQDGLLLLRNGHLLEGQVTRAGDYFIVTQGETSEIRMPADEVEALCGSLDEAYEFKARQVGSNGIGPRLDLAEWCLRHNLYARCAEQLIAAMQIAPENERLLLLERRLALAVEAPEPLPSPATPFTAEVAVDAIDKAIRDLPEASIERFTTIVQPILLNRCSAGNCHGPSATSEFRLLRPLAGQVANQRFTQRNLYAALQHVNRSEPEASPLLSMPQRRHGTALVAVFDERTRDQLDELRRWVQLATTPAAPAAAPLAPSQAPTTLAQAPITPANASSRVPAVLPATAMESAQPLTGSATDRNVHAMRPSLDQDLGASGPAKSTSSARVGPRDRYDAEIFNRRFHSP